MIIDLWNDRLKWWKVQTWLFIAWVGVTLVHCSVYIMEGRWWCVAVDVAITVGCVVCIVSNIRTMRYIRSYIRGLSREYWND